MTQCRHRCLILSAFWNSKGRSTASKNSANNWKLTFKRDASEGFSGRSAKACEKVHTYNNIKAWSENQSDGTCYQDDEKTDDEEHREAEYFQGPTNHDVNDDREKETAQCGQREIEQKVREVVAFDGVPE